MIKRSIAGALAAWLLMAASTLPTLANANGPRPFGVVASPEGTFWWAQGANQHAGGRNGDCFYQRWIHGVRGTRYVSEAPDGTLWFSSPLEHKIVRVSRHTSNVYNVGVEPSAMAASNGTAFFVSPKDSRIGYIRAEKVAFLKAPRGATLSGIAMYENRPVIGDLSDGSLLWLQHNASWDHIKLARRSLPWQLLSDKHGAIHVLDVANSRILVLSGSRLNQRRTIQLRAPAMALRTFAIDEDGYWLGAGRAVLHVSLTGATIETFKAISSVREIAAAKHDVTLTEENGNIGTIYNGALREHVLSEEMAYSALVCRSSLLPAE